MSSTSKAKGRTGAKESKAGASPNVPASAQAAPTSIIECPSELGTVARQEWDRIIGTLAETGVLMPLDRGLLAIYCGAYAQWLEAMEAIQKYGTMMKSPSGYPIQSPYVAIANKQAEIMMKIASEFGFTPASRGRLWMISNACSDLLELKDLSEL
jgi:P27 family predicted phage terminase small subunit